jgi:hypothetical protein
MSPTGLEAARVTYARHDWSAAFDQLESLDLRAAEDLERLAMAALCLRTTTSTSRCSNGPSARTSTKATGSARPGCASSSRASA